MFCSRDELICLQSPFLTLPLWAPDIESREPGRRMGGARQKSFALLCNVQYFSRQRFRIGITFAALHVEKWRKRHVHYRPTSLVEQHGAVRLL